MPKQKQFIPLETDEQKVLVQYLELKSLKFTAVPNSTYTKSWKQKAKNKAEGLRAGFPDLIICLPNKLLCLELKRIKGGVVSPSQKEWNKALNNIGGNVEAIICNGANEAISKIEKRLKR